MTLKNLLLSFLFLSLKSFSQAPSIEWQKCLGGTNNEHAVDIKQTSDGGFILVGATNSIDGDITSSYGNSDVWVVKLDVLGNIQWQKTYGGSLNEEAFSIIQTSDGGYIFAGYTRSSDGDVTLMQGSSDYWIVKLNPLGDIEWQKTYGGTFGEIAYSIVQTTDGGFAIAGFTSSINGDVIFNNGFNDVWVIKLNVWGELIWQKTFGGNNFDESFSIQQTSDGGFIVAGETYSNNGDITNNQGASDFWVIKLNNNGELQWQKTYGGSQFDTAFSIILNSTGGYVIAGYTKSNNGDVVGNNGDYDFWVIKIDDSGNLVWQKALGGTGIEKANSIQQTIDGGYIVVGESSSNNGYVTANLGMSDTWVIKLNANGDLIWQKSFGGSNDDYALRVIQTIDNGYAFVGGTFSNDFDVSGYNGGLDVWVVKLFPDNLSNHEVSLVKDISVYPNPTKNFINIFSKKEIQKIELFDIKGLKIYESKQVNDKVSLENFSKGVYVLKIILENGEIISEKVIKK